MTILTNVCAIVGAIVLLVVAWEGFWRLVDVTMRRLPPRSIIKGHCATGYGEWCFVIGAGRFWIGWLRSWTLNIEGRNGTRWFNPIHSLWIGVPWSKR